MPTLEKVLTVAVKWNDGRHYFGTIIRALPRDRFKIKFEDGDITVKRSKNIFVLMTTEDYRYLCEKLVETEGARSHLQSQLYRQRAALSAAHAERNRLERKIDAENKRRLSKLPRNLHEPKSYGRHQREIATTSNSVIYGD